MVRPGYKQTEIGEIPEDWDVSAIGNNTVWMSGGTPSRNNPEYWSGTIPWISGSTLKNSEIFTSDQFLTNEAVAIGSKIAPLNSTLILVRGSALHSEIRAGLVVAPVSFNQDVKALVPDKTIYPKYLTFYILGMTNELLRLVSSAGNSAGVLDTALLQNFRFLKPALEEQIAIAKALSDVDELIVSLEKLIAKKRDIKTATMQQLLTGKKRLPGFDEGKGTKQTELGKIPEDWDVKSYGEVFLFLTTASNSRDDLSENGEVFYVHYGDIHIKFDFQIDFESDHIPRIESRKLKTASFMQDGDLIMADASEDYEGIGKSVEVKGLLDEKAISGLHTFLLRDIGNVFAPGYRGYLHSITPVKKLFDRLATGLKVPD